MLQKTKGIVFQRTSYGETSVIVKIYTELFGLQSYIIRGARKAKARAKANHLQHLSIFELVVYNKRKTGIQHIKELKLAYQFQAIPFQIMKSSILVFLNEVLLKSIRESESNPEQFSFLEKSLIELDQCQTPLNFHVLFLIQLTRYLGFYPRNNRSNQHKYFNLQEGVYENSPASQSLSMDEKLGGLLSQLISVQVSDHEKIELSGAERYQLIVGLMRYYELHLPGFGNIKSLEVLREVLS